MRVVLRRTVVVVVVLATLAVVVGLALVGWDARFLARVVRHGDASTGDHRWKAAVHVAPAATPMSWAGGGQCPPDQTGDGERALLVVHHGMMVCARYTDGAGPDVALPAFSVSKTVLSLLVSRAVEQGALPSLDTAVGTWLPELADRDPALGAITLAELLDMRSGLGFEAVTGFPWVDQDAPAVYYATDLAGTVLHRPRLTDPPGTFRYNDYNPNLVGLVLARATGRPLQAHLQHLWEDLGAAHPASWSVDDRGFAYHESGLVVAPTDLARIGQLVLDGGTVGDRQVAPQAFLDRSTDPAGAAVVATFGGVDVGYRNGWWVLARDDGGSPDLVAMGRHGQVMLVSGATDSVLVRMGVEGHPETNIDIAVTLQRLASTLQDGD